MAALTWYLTNNSVSIGSDLSDTDPGTEAYRSPVTGWIVSTGATNHSPYQNDVERAAATFVNTTQPNGTLENVSGDGDFWTSPAPLTGDFANANWSVHFACRAQTNGGAQDGRMRCRLFRGPNQDGSSATEITSAQQSGGLVTDLTTSATQVSTATFNPGAFSVSNEYIFIELAWERTGAGGMTSSDVNARIGNGSGTGCRVITADFTAANPQTVTPSTLALTLATFAAIVTVTAHQLVTPTTKALSLATFAPTVTVASAAQTVTPGTASLTTATFAPTVTATANQLVTPTTATLTLTGFAPTILADEEEELPAPPPAAEPHFASVSVYTSVRKKRKRHADDSVWLLMG